MVNGYSDSRTPPYNLLVVRGTQYRKTVLWRQKAAPQTPYDLTSYTARMEMRKEALDPSDTTPEAADLVLTSSSGITLGGTAGTVEIVITAAQTRLLPEHGVYELKLYQGEEPTINFLHGSFTAVPEITLDADPAP
jgi:hypothetical protein